MAGLSVRRADEIVEHHRAGLLGGIVALQTPATVPDAPWGDLYRSALDRATGERDVTLVAIPYFTWANRGPSRMAVWLRQA